MIVTILYKSRSSFWLSINQNIFYDERQVSEVVKRDRLKFDSSGSWVRIPHLSILDGERQPRYKKITLGNLKIDGIIYLSKLRQALARAQATYKQHALGLAVANDRLAKWLNARCLSYSSIKFILK
jgi:hypothetical protein